MSAPMSKLERTIRHSEFLHSELWVIREEGWHEWYTMHRDAIAEYGIISHVWRHFWLAIEGFRNMAFGLFVRFVGARLLHRFLLHLADALWIEYPEEPEIYRNILKAYLALDRYMEPEQYAIWDAENQQREEARQREIQEYFNQPPDPAALGRLFAELIGLPDDPEAIECGQKLMELNNLPDEERLAAHAKLHDALDAMCGEEG